MKYEILRIQNLDKQYGLQPIFRNLSFNIYAGEAVGLLIPPLSGKTTLANILRGNEEFSGTAFFNEEPVKDSFKDYNASGEIVCIFKNSRLFPNLTVSENMFVATAKHASGSVIDHKRINAMARQYLEELGIDASPAEKAVNLDVFTQHMILLAAAMYHEVKLVVFDDSFESYAAERMESLYRIMKLLNRRGISAIWLSSSYGEPFRFLDRVIVIHDTHKAHTLTSPSDYTKVELQKLLSAGNSTPPNSALSHVLSSRPPASGGDAPAALELHKLTTPRLDAVNLILPAGFCAGIASRDLSSLQELSDLFTSDPPDMRGKVFISGKSALLYGGIIGCGRDYTLLRDAFASEQIMAGFSFFDNIYIPISCARKTHPLSFNLGLQKALAQEIESFFGFSAQIQQRPIESFDIHTLQNAVLFRLLFLRPAFVVFFSSYEQIDLDAQELFLRYFRSYKQAGISVLIVSPRLEPFMEIIDEAYELAESANNPDKSTLLKI